MSFLRYYQVINRGAAAFFNQMISELEQCFSEPSAALMTLTAFEGQKCCGSCL
jgi:hypothetical protein